MRGKRMLSNKQIRKLGTRLNLAPGTIDSFAKKRKRIVNPESPPPIPFEQLKADAFAAISDWCHDAILELTHVEAFRSDPRWISRTLGISVPEVHEALDRLSRLGMIKKENGRWVNQAGSTTVIDSDYEGAAYRKLQVQLLQKAQEAIDEVDIKYRDQSSMTMAVSLDRLKEAEQMITKFRRELCAFLEGGKEKQDVFALTISLFPLTRLFQKNNSLGEEK